MWAVIKCGRGLCGRGFSGVGGVCGAWCRLRGVKGVGLVEASIGRGIAMGVGVRRSCVWAVIECGRHGRGLCGYIWGLEL